MNGNHKNILHLQTGCITEEALLLYAENKLPASDVRLAEEHLADCPFCSDALDGILEMNDTAKAKSFLQEIAEELKEKKPVEKIRVFSMKRALQMAAVIAVVALSAWLVNVWMKPDTDKIFTDQFQPYSAPAISQQEPSTPSDANRLDSVATNKNVPPPATIKFTPPVSGYVNKEVTSGGATKDKSVTEDLQEAPPAPDAEAPVVFDQTTTVNDDYKDIVMEEKEADKTFSSTSVQSPVISNAPVQNNLSSADESVTTISRTEGAASTYLWKKDETEKYAIADSMNVAMNFYNSKQYWNAVQSFERILVADPKNYEANFYSGVSYLTLNQPDAAIAKLKKIDNEKSASIYEAVLWYEALAYVKKNDRKSAENFLNKVIELNGTYKQQAEETIKKL